MDVRTVDVPGYEVVYRLTGQPSGWVALHRKVDGRAFGGLRIRAYPDTDAARDDALRLARAMTRKLAAVDIPGGGGKAVLEAGSLGPDRGGAIGRFADWVESLAGAYVTGPDLGVDADDLAVLHRHTTSIASGDLSTPTALGVHRAIRGALQVVRGDAALRERSIAIQGLGAIGGRLARRLADDGAQLWVADVDGERCRELARTVDVTIVPPDDVLTRPVDVVAPCAIGGVIDRARVAALNTGIVCGGANNILDHDQTADLLHARGVVLVPDFLANAGGAIHGAWTHLKGSGDYTAEVLTIEARTVELLEEAARRDLPPLRIALERWGEG